MRKILFYLMLIVITATACSKLFGLGEGAYKPVANAGVYVSVDSLIVAPAGMYTYSIYASGAKPIFDQALIKKYVQRKGLSGFVFDTTVLYGNPGITVTFKDNNDVTFSSTKLGSDIKGSVVADGRTSLKNEDSVYLYFMLFQSFDQRLVTNFLYDSCGRLNAGFAMINMTIYNTQRYIQFPIEITNEELSAVRFVSASFIRSGSVQCSSVLVNELGYDYERATWTKDTYTPTNRFKDGDTLVIQAKKVYLRRQ